MFKNLSPVALGVTGRQSELIELALTYGFRGFDLDVGDFVKRSKNHGLDKARRFIDSAHIKIGEFELPVDWREAETSYKADLAQLPEIAEIAASIGAVRCYANILPASDDRPYHENFEMHRERLGEIGELLARHNIRLGLALSPAPSLRADRPHEFIHQVEPLLLLVNSVASSNVGLVLDTWSWHFGDGGADQLRELPPDKIVAVRLADAPEDADPTTIEPQQRLLPGETGVVDCTPFLSLLAGMDYEGPVTVCPNPRRFTGMTRDAIVQKASDSVDRQYRAAGLNKSGKPIPAEAP